jgi:hypothetical protein
MTKMPSLTRSIL